MQVLNVLWTIADNVSSDTDQTDKVPVRESAGPPVRGAASLFLYTGESGYCQLVNNAGSTTGCRDAVDEYNSF